MKLKKKLEVLEVASFVTEIKRTKAGAANAHDALLDVNISRITDPTHCSYCIPETTFG